MQDSAREAAKSATTAASLKFGELRRSVADLVRIIKTFAQTTGNDNVYVLAQVPPPQNPSTVPPPAKPTDLRIALDPSTGAPTITWKAANPRGSSGTSYIIRRRTAATGAFDFIGVTGTKKFIDNTFFAGPDSVQYTVQGQRSDSSGPVSDILIINFGRVSGGGFSVSTIANDTGERNSESNMTFRKKAA